MECISYVNGFSIDLSKVRTIKKEEINNQHCVVVEYVGNFVYSKNPFTDEIEKDLHNETIVKEYRNHQYASETFEMLNDAWQEYAGLEN
jgi:hypothetical protein